jgi:ribosome biogenesis GTPase
MGVVTAQHPRHSELCRPDSRGKLRPVAANIDRIAIVVAPYPEPHANLIDRYLVAAEHQSIQPIVILHKADLIDDNNYEILTGLLDCYIKLGYDCFLTSAQSGEGIERIEDYLEGLTSVFVGQSGVGKSSLLNTLSPDINTPVGALSVSKAKGTHTTTNSQLFHLPNGGDVIDSPGIREFGLWHLAPPSIAEGFIELRPFIGQCKFRDCQHQKEPSCAFKQAVDDGNISKKRFDSYWHMINSLEQES